MGEVRVREAGRGDYPEVLRRLVAAWHAPVIVLRGSARDLSHEPALVAEVTGADRRIVGTLHYLRFGTTMEIASLEANGHQRQGVGTALVEAAADVARRHNCYRLFATTTNDNLDALRFYQRRGFRLVTLRPGAVDEARLTKPEIPTVGEYGIPLRDEIDVERPV
jgi:N-acetylglutamate synthase-like GNAT family acetyltransferase